MTSAPRCTPLLLLGCVALAACGAGPGGPATGPGGDDDDEAIVLDFSASPVPEGSGTGPDLEAEGGTGEIFARGAVGTSVPCASVQGDAARVQSRVGLRVTVTADESCPTRADTFAYDATIGNLDAGGYRFVIVHSTPESTDTVLDRQLEVR